MRKYFKCFVFCFDFVRKKNGDENLWVPNFVGFDTLHLLLKQKNLNKINPTNRVFYSDHFLIEISSINLFKREIREKTYEILFSSTFFHQ